MGTIYVDMGYGPAPRFEVNRAQLRAIGQVCRLCGGQCCLRFSYCCRFDSQGLIDVKAWREAVKAKSPGYRKDVNYAIRNLVLVDRADHSTGCFTCRNLTREGRCADYRNRPGFCRGYVCRTAWFDGKPPTKDTFKMETHKLKEYADFEPLDCVLADWAKHVKPVADAYWDRVKPRDYDPSLDPINPNWLAEYALEHTAGAGCVGCDGSFDYDPRGHHMEEMCDVIPLEKDG